MKNLDHFKPFDISNILFWIYFCIYNLYFGWNEVPMNETEEFFDKIRNFWLLINFGLFLSPFWAAAKKSINNYLNK
jgi:hypothetical protein